MSQPDKSVACGNLAKKKKIDKFKDNFPWLSLYNPQPPAADDRADVSPTRATVALYLEYITHCNLRFTLYDFYYEVLNFYYFSLSQLYPTAVQKINTFILVCHFLGLAWNLLDFC